MKIEKLHTLSQFINNTIDTFNESIERGIMAGLLYKLIIRYTNFLNQPILEHVIWNKYKALDEAEAKVIFANVQKVKQPGSYNLSDRYNIGFTDNSGIYVYDSQLNTEISVKTYLDLAIATNGELPMQNLDI